MQKRFYLALPFLLFACVSTPGLKNDLLDSSTLPNLSEAQELRLGDIRYGKQRLEEREALFSGERLGERIGFPPLG